MAGCGIVTVRQQPQTAKGTIFVTLEDETGPVNVIVWKSLREAQRAELLHSRLLAVYGVWQRSEESGTAGTRSSWVRPAGRPTWWRTGWKTSRRCWGG